MNFISECMRVLLSVCRLFFIFVALFTLIEHCSNRPLLLADASRVDNIYIGNDYMRIDALSLSDTTNQLFAPKMYIGYHGTSGKLYAHGSRDLMKGERLQCINYADLITDQMITDRQTNEDHHLSTPIDFAPFLPTDCYEDSSCRSTLMSLKLGLCLEDVVNCRDLGVSDRTRDYYRLVFERIQAHQYPHLWNTQNIHHLNHTIIGSQLIDSIKGFDSEYQMMTKIMAKIREADPLNPKYQSAELIGKRNWYYYRLMAISRGFSIVIDGTDVYAMAPQIDMADHGFEYRNEVSAIWGYEDIRKRLCVYATKNIPKGTEILSDYGITDARHACLNYGIYDASLDLTMYFNKASGDELFMISRKDTSDSKILRSRFTTIKNMLADEKTITRDLCDTVQKTDKTYTNVLNKIYTIQQGSARNQCITKILEDEMKIINNVNKWMCGSII